jgi:hypothetical protein
MVFFNVHNSILYHETNYKLDDYYKYIIHLLKNFLTNNPSLNINISLENNIVNFDNNNKTVRININSQHTIVKQGGGNCHKGNILDHENKPFLVSIDNFMNLNNGHIVIDYSNPNIFNVKSCYHLSNFSSKHIYISPSLYNVHNSMDNRYIKMLTTFTDISKPRRVELVKRINERNMEHFNVDNFNKNDLQNLYKNTQILLNVHQTENQHTFEEIRVLPALQCGVIVISETCPLSNLVPYSDYIIWCPYDNILDMALNVTKNYEHYYESIFLNKKNNTLDSFNETNYNTLSNKISDVVSQL